MDFELPSDLAKLSPNSLRLVLAKERARRIRENQLRYYRPYAKQREFHTAGATYRERLFMAGNQLGKTLSGSMEYAMHLTGIYPNWWEGRRWQKPINGWAAGVTGELTRDGVQRLLMGRPNEIGTGAIPKSHIIDYSLKRGVADAIDTVQVKYGGGGDAVTLESLFTFKSYDQGRTKFQQETLDLIWLDEEPAYYIYMEALTRTNATNGMVMMTFTPLEGMTQTVMRFLTEKAPGTIVINMTIDDVDHYTPELRQQIISSYPEHERDARTKGFPMLGSGRIFPLPEEAIKVPAIQLPAWWPRIAAIDFGWDHPTAIVWMAWDRETDTIYVYDCYREKNQPVGMHAAVLISKGQWIPVAWPHDGLNDTAVGPQLAQQYRDAGVNMLFEKAHYLETNADGTTKSVTSVEAGIQDLLSRMKSGRLKVFSHLNDWFEEFRMYHRKDGKIIKLNDDLMSATRYGTMMLRYAECHQQTIHLPSVRGGNWRVL